MRKIARIAGLFCLSIFSAKSFAYLNDYPRLYLWGLAGAKELGRADLLLPIFENNCSLFYTDFQGKLATDNASLMSGGLGYRGIKGNRIYGGYLFLDRNYSEDHNQFYVLSPGLEV